MLRLFTFASILVAASCSICCAPKQWEGVESSTVGQKVNDAGTRVESSSNVSYDATNERVAATIYLQGDGYTTSVKFILDFANGIQYTMNGTQCTRTALGAFQEYCIPDGAKGGDNNFNFGAGSATLDLKSYETAVGNLSYTNTVTAAGCIPVAEMLLGAFNNRYIFQITSFTGITPGIKDPSVFTPPASCLQGRIYPASFDMLSPMGRRMIRML